MKQNIELTDGAFEVLRSAVTIAKNRQVQSAATLREHLERHYPNRKDDIDAALLFWGNRIAESENRYGE